MLLPAPRHHFVRHLQFFALIIYQWRLTIQIIFTVHLTLILPHLTNLAKQYTLCTTIQFVGEFLLYCSKVRGRGGTEGTRKWWPIEYYPIFAFVIAKLPIMVATKQSILWKRSTEHLIPFRIAMPNIQSICHNFLSCYQIVEFQVFPPNFALTAATNYSLTIYWTLFR